MSLKVLKKGFTIVELVIVIAVIAILAAVLIPTFANLVDKANETVDMQLVKQMNTVLEAEEILGNKANDRDGVELILSNNGITQYKPVNNDNIFYWMQDENRIVLWDKINSKVIYPNNYKDKTISLKWYNLNYDEVVITPSEGESLESALIAGLKNSSTTKEVYLTLPENETLTFTGNEFTDFFASAQSNGIGKNVHLNLNNGTLNINNPNYGFWVYSNGNMELSNGTLNFDDTQGKRFGLFSVKSGGSLVLDNMKVYGTSYASIFPAGEANEIMIKNSEIKTDSYFAFSTNGHTSNNLKLSIINSKIEVTNDEYVGVLVNVKSTIKIENSTIIGGSQGLVIRSGDAEIKNSTIKIKNTNIGNYKWDNFTTKDPTYCYWADGNTFPSAALVLGDHSKDVSSYFGDVNCNLSNVTLEVANETDSPKILLASKKDKNVNLTYDQSSNITEFKLYDFPHENGLGTVTINNNTILYTAVAPNLNEITFDGSNRYTIRTGTFLSYVWYSVNDLDAESLAEFKQHCSNKGYNLTDAQWATATFAPGSVANSIKSLRYDLNAQ